jgi:hypothetical protein
MNNSFRQQGSDTGSREQRGISAGLQIFAGLLKWLAKLLGLTEEERTDAGIYLDDQRYK